MNNMQLYLAIGIPTITVILSWLSSRAEAARLNEKIDRVNQNLTAKIEHLGEVLNAKVDNQATTLRAELTAIRVDHHKDNLALMGYMVPLHERMAKLESRD